MLAGKGSRGLIKTRVALEDDAKAEISGITEGNAEGARGHVDCMETLMAHGLSPEEAVEMIVSGLLR